MKNLFSILFTGAVTLLSAQCTISGLSAGTVGQEINLTASGADAQCTECHLWVTVGSAAAVKGDNRLKTVKVTSATAGRQVVSLAVLTPQGLVQCSKNLDFTAAKTAVKEPVKNVAAVATPVESDAPVVSPPICDVPATNFKEIKFDAATVSLFPEIQGNDFKYNWTANYSDGTTSTSQEKVPRFEFSKTKPISSVRLQIISQRCMKEFIKRYDNNFWTYF